MNRYQKQINKEANDIHKYNQHYKLKSYQHSRKAIRYFAKRNKKSRVKVLCSNCCSSHCGYPSMNKLAYCKDWD